MTTHDLPNRILLATDLSARSDRAQDRALELARDWKATLTVVHAIDVADVPTDEPTTPAAEVARIRALRLLRAEEKGMIDVAPDIVVAEGSPPDVVLDVARRQSTDLILTGIAGNGPLGQLILGSTATTLVRKATVPVVVVKKRAQSPYGRVVVASDLSDASVAALEWALRLFAPSQVTLDHVFHLPFRGLVDDKDAYEEGGRANAMEQAQAFVATHLGARATEITIKVASGDVARSIAEHAAEMDADLVIAGTHGRTGLLSVLLGSVAVTLLDQVQCDIMIVPSKGARPSA